MTDPNGALAFQRRGDVAFFDGVQWQSSQHGVAADTTIGQSMFTQGSSAYPASATGATIYASRDMGTNADGADSNAAIWAISKNAGATQPVAVHGGAQQNGVGDACALYGVTNVAGLAGASYGLFADASINAHTCTISNASPAVITVTAHGLAADREVQFGVSSGGGLPTGLSIHTRYFVLAAGLTANSFQVSTSPGGAAVNTSSAGSGTFYVSGNSIFATNPVTDNSSGIDFVYSGSGTNSITNIALQALGSNLGGTGIWFIPTSGKPNWSEGIVIDGITNQSIYDVSSSVTSIKVTGSHSYGIDLSGGTFSTKAIYAPRTRTITLPIGSASIGFGVPDLAARGSNNRYRAWAFDDSTVEGVIVELQVPQDYSTGAGFGLLWANSGTNSGNVRWGIATKGRSAGDDLNSTAGETNTGTAYAASTTAGAFIATPHSSAPTLTAGQLINVLVYRSGNDAADTLVGDAWLVGVNFTYTADM